MNVRSLCVCMPGCPSHNESCRAVLSSNAECFPICRLRNSIHRFGIIFTVHEILLHIFILLAALAYNKTHLHRNLRSFSTFFFHFCLSLFFVRCNSRSHTKFVASMRNYIAIISAVSDVFSSHQIRRLRILFVFQQNLHTRTKHII